MDNTNTITKEQISEILVKYDIGKEPLALLLGWGAKNIIRYLKKDNPPEGQYGEMLHHIYNEPEYYMLLLQRYKNNISPVAYDKSEKATKLLLNEKIKDSDYLNKLIENIAKEITGELSGFDFSAKCIYGILDKINNNVENSKMNIEAC